MNFLGRVTGSLSGIVLKIEEQHLEQCWVSKLDNKVIV